MDEKHQRMEEIKVIMQIDYPGILKIHDYKDDEHNFYVITELYTGGNLFDELSEVYKFTERRASLIIKQLLLALKHAREKHNITHRYLKLKSIYF